MDRLRVAESQPNLEAPRSPAKSAQIGAGAWVVVLVLPVLIVALFALLGLFGVLVRVF